MNANEITVLIGLLQSKAQTTGKINAFIKQSAATMLRQLQSQLDACRESKKEDVAEIYKLQAEIEALKAEVKQCKEWKESLHGWSKK